MLSAKAHLNAKNVQVCIRILESDSLNNGISVEQEDSNQKNTSSLQTQM